MELRELLLSQLEKANEARIYDINQSVEIAHRVLESCDTDLLNDIKAKAFSQLSLYLMISGKNEECLQYAQNSITLYEILNDEKGIADAKYSMAGVYYKTNNFHIGLVFLIDALNIYKKYDDYYNISRCEKSIGTVYDYSDDRNNAIQSYENAIAAAKQINDLNLESNAYNNLSGVYIKTGKIDLASKLIAKSLKLKNQTGDIRGLAFAVYGNAKVLFAQKEYDRAIAQLEEAIQIHTEMGERLGLAMCYHKLAKLYREMGQLDKAKAVLSKAIDYTDLYNITIIRFKCYHVLYTIHKTEGDDIKALQYLEKYLEEKEKVLNSQTLRIIDSYDMLVKMKTMQKEAELQKENAEIIEKSNRTEESARVRQEFLSTMSHEIRTPLNAITTIVSMLGDNYSGEDKKLISSLKFSSNLLMWIINDILDFTKLDLGKMKLEEHPVQLQPLLENIWRTYKYQAKEKGLQFQFNTAILPDQTYYIDKTRITQILGNLMNNAIKFTDAGTVAMDVEVLKYGTKHDTIRFKIADTGEGIGQEDLHKIFESFSQIKNTITRKKGGTGLGLAIVKSLVELHHSNIHVNSVIGSGTKFWFDLKLQKGVELIENKIISVPKSLQGKKVLLAEDNSINALIAIKLLSTWGVVTDLAINGLEAVQKANKNEYDFILMDIHMPEMDGFEATKEIRKMSLNTEIPIYGLTADISAKDNTAAAAYFTGFLLKPLEIEKLHLTLTESCA